MGCPLGGTAAADVSVGLVKLGCPDLSSPKGLKYGFSFFKIVFKPNSVSLAFENQFPKSEGQTIYNLI